MKKFQILNNTIGYDEPVYIIAEAGVNHNGDITIAKALIEKAKEVGADAVKFQSYITDELVADYAEQADYQIKNIGAKSTQKEMLKKYELSHQDHIDLIDHAAKMDITFLSTPFDFISVDRLDQLNIPAYKIGSGDCNNIPLLRYIAQKRKPILLSTGMSDFNTVKKSVSAIYEENPQADIALLHCVSSYPAPYGDINLMTIKSLYKMFDLPSGYSDHTLGIEIPIAAVALGAKIIEKHLTLDKNMLGPDHAASLNPTEFKEMVCAIRHVETALGDGNKKIMGSEQNAQKVAQKSLRAKRDLKAGEILTEESISIKRPADGLEPAFFYSILNKTVKCDIKMDTPFAWDMIDC